MENKIKLTKIKSLTFESDEYTNSRRLKPIPQLECLGNNCDKYLPESIHCENVGKDEYTNHIQWRCTTSLPRNLKLGEVFYILIQFFYLYLVLIGKVRVNCEGYNSSDDPYVLKG